MEIPGKNDVALEKVIRRDPEIHSGDLVFAGTRVPVDILMSYLKGGRSIEEFLRDYPTVERRQLELYLDLSLQRLDQWIGQNASAT